MYFYPHFARCDYNKRTGEYVPTWQKIARAHRDIKISDAECNLNNFGQYSPAYATTNEDWRFAMSELNPVGKSVLTVTASGDQPIAFAISGATKIDTFDTSYFARVIMDLKTSAIQTLDHGQYNQFVRELRDTKSVRDIRGYDKIATVCPKQTIVAARQMAGCKIFNAGTGTCSEYMPTDQEYNIAKQKITGPMNFIWSDLQNLCRELNQEYDIIYLSNIFEYFTSKKKISSVLHSLYPFIKNGGEIMLYTSWVQTGISESIDAAARACGWGETKSHNRKNAFMLTMTRTR